MIMLRRVVAPVERALRRYGDLPLSRYSCRQYWVQNSSHWGSVPISCLAFCARSVWTGSCDSDWDPRWRSPRRTRCGRRLHPVGRLPGRRLSTRLSHFADWPERRTGRLRRGSLPSTVFLSRICSASTALGESHSYVAAGWVHGIDLHIRNSLEPADDGSLAGRHIGVGFIRIGTGPQVRCDADDQVRVLRDSQAVSSISGCSRFVTLRPWRCGFCVTRAGRSSGAASDSSW